MNLICGSFTVVIGSYPDRVKASRDCNDRSRQSKDLEVATSGLN